MIFFHWAIVMAGFGNEIGEFDLFLYIQFNNWYLTFKFHQLFKDPRNMQNGDFSLFVLRLKKSRKEGRKTNYHYC